MGCSALFLAAVLLAVAPKFIVGASGIEFQRAAIYVIPLIIWGAFQFPSWVGDIVQLGSDKPYLKAMLVFAEQLIRIFFMWILLERFQVTALIIAYFIGLFAKGIAAYLVNNKYCYPQRFFVWQSLAAPLLAGAAHFRVHVLADRINLDWRPDNQHCDFLHRYFAQLPGFHVPLRPGSAAGTRPHWMNWPKPSRWLV